MFWFRFNKCLDNVWTFVCYVSLCIYLVSCLVLAGGVGVSTIVCYVYVCSDAVRLSISARPIELIFSPSHPCPVSTATLLVGTGMGLFRGGSMRRIPGCERWDGQSTGYSR